jgi:hypothetical protein
LIREATRWNNDLLRESAAFRQSRRKTFQRRGYGRDEDLSPPPAQIRTCDFPAYGSYLG